MWGTQYDENLRNNPLFSEILSNHSDLVFKASQENWVICIPRVGILEPEEITISTILDHILVPTSEHIWYTLSKKRVTIENKVITTTTTSKILFEETFYIESLKYSVFCVDKPLFSCRTICDHTVTTLETLDDCIDFLWSENLSHVLIKIQKLCASFVEQHDLTVESLQSQKDLTGSLYSQCLQLALKSRSLGDCDNVKIAVEAYMQSCLDRTLIWAVNTVTCFSDAVLNKKVRNSSGLQLKDLNIAKFCDIVTSAKSELCKINNYVTILDKVNCLKLTFNRLCNGICLTSDDLLQILVFLIVKLNVSNWTSNLVYLSHFQFSSLDVSNESSFLVTSLEAALEFIKTEELTKVPSHQTPLFQAVISNDLPTIKEALERNTTKVDLCHPLCDCDNCAPNSSHTTTINEKGQSLLAFAAIHGRPEIVEFLISIGAEVNGCDYFNRTPLHYACLRGHQDVLLILTNSRADCNVRDNDGNTPLHLACDNGHENCVKALFYTSVLETDCGNRRGDTPLHLAVKWNYVEIVRVLLENNVGAHISNKKNQTPIMLAQNCYIERLLKEFHGDLEPVDSSEQVVAYRINNCKDHGIKPKGVELLKKIDLLLKAIENNDYPLTCFYLGFPSTNTYNFQSKCHPLCNCDKCEDRDGGPALPTEPLNVNTCNIDGFTPLHFAAKYGRSELLRVLLDSQAHPNLKTYKTLQTPLHLACINRRLQAVKELVSCENCEVDSRDYKGNTPLYYACLKNDAKIVEVLLGSGASCEVRNYQGVSVVKEVREKRLFGISSLMKEPQEDFL